MSLTHKNEVIFSCWNFINILCRWQSCGFLLSLQSSVRPLCSYDICPDTFKKCDLVLQRNSNRYINFLKELTDNGNVKIFLRYWFWMMAWKLKISHWNQTKMQYSDFLCIVSAFVLWAKCGAFYSIQNWAAHCCDVAWCWCILWETLFSWQMSGSYHR
jgi:hypothetical protein